MKSYKNFIFTCLFLFCLILSAQNATITDVTKDKAPSLTTMEMIDGRQLMEVSYYPNGIAIFDPTEGWLRTLITMDSCENGVKFKTSSYNTTTFVPKYKYDSLGAYINYFERQLNQAKADKKYLREQLNSSNKEVKDGYILVNMYKHWILVILFGLIGFIMFVVGWAQDENELLYAGVALMIIAYFCA